MPDTRVRDFFEVSPELQQQLEKQIVALAIEGEAWISCHRRNWMLFVTVHKGQHLRGISPRKSAMLDGHIGIPHGVTDAHLQYVWDCGNHVLAACLWRCWQAVGDVESFTWAGRL